MAYPRESRRAAREMYVRQDRSYRQIAETLGVGKTTVLRWSRAEDWDELREQERRIELESRKLLLRMIDAAQEEGDAQLTFAAVHAAKLAGVQMGPPDSGPRPKEVAVVLLDVLARHPEIGPVVRRFRQEVIRLVLQEVKRMEASSQPGGPS